MAEATEQMNQGDDPTNFKVETVNAYLKDADQDERGRVLQAELDGQERVGILTGPYGTDQRDGQTGDEPRDASDVETPTGEGTVHQEGAPEALVQASDTARAQGFIGEPAEGKPDYTQGNPDVMTGRA